MTCHLNQHINRIHMEDSNNNMAIVKAFHHTIHHMQMPSLIRISKVIYRHKVLCRVHLTFSHKLRQIIISQILSLRLVLFHSKPNLVLLLSNLSNLNQILFLNKLSLFTPSNKLSPVLPLLKFLCRAFTVKAVLQQDSSNKLVYLLKTIHQSHH